MGIVLLLIFIGIELFFLIWNMKAETCHRKEKRVAHICLFLIFIIASAAGALEWGFRYYMLGLVLAIQAAAAVTAFIKKKKDSGKSFGYGKCIWRFAGKSILYSTALTLAVLCPQYKQIAPTGEYEVAAYTKTLVDEEREETFEDTGAGREVNVEFWYPAEGASDCPLFIFSHGMFGVKITNVSLFEELASHGFVVCSLDHPYHSFFTVNDEGKVTTISPECIQQYATVNSSDNVRTMYPFILEWMKIRGGDMNFVLDELKRMADEGAQDAELDKICRMADTDTVIAAGHSMGGSAAAELGRTRDDIACAVILEAPYFGDIEGVEHQHFLWDETPYPVPVLNIYSDNTWGKMQDSLVYVQNQRMLEAQRPDWQSVYISGARHLGLTDLSLFCPAAAEALDGGKGSRDAHEILQEINETALAFIETYTRQ